MCIGFVFLKRVLAIYDFIYRCILVIVGGVSLYLAMLKFLPNFLPQCAFDVMPDYSKVGNGC